VALAWGLADLAARLRLPRLACGAVAGLALAVLAGLTWAQVGTWRDTPTLWGRALAVTRANHRAHVNLGEDHLDRGPPRRGAGPPGRRPAPPGPRPPPGGRGPPATFTACPCWRWGGWTRRPARSARRCAAPRPTPTPGTTWGWRCCARAGRGRRPRASARRW